MSRPLDKGGRTKPLVLAVSMLLCWCHPGLAQPVAVLQNQEVEIMDGNNRRGELIYDVYVLDADRVAENTFDFRGAKRARIRVDVRVSARNSKWDERMRVGIARRAFAQHNPQFWKIVDERQVILGTVDPVEQLIFETRREGTSNLFVPFSFLDTTQDNWENSGNWLVSTSVKNRIAVPRITVRGLFKETVAEHSPAATSVAGLVDYIRASDSDPGLVAESRAELEKRIKQDAREYIYKSGSDRTTIQQFLARYEPLAGKGITVVDDHVKMTRNYLDKYLPAEPAVSPEDKVKPTPNVVSQALREINRALQNRDTSEARRTILAYGDRFPDRITELRDSLLCWTPAAYRVLARKGAREQVELVNFKSPAYYDVFSGRLEINDSTLVNDHVLDVALLRSDPISIEIQDKACPDKRVTISLDNLMSAEVRVDSVRGLYHITFQGGKMPYGIQLVATDGSERSWSRRNIRASELTLSRDSLQDAGLSGAWRAEAFSTGSDKAVPVAGRSIVVPDRPTPAWLWPVLLAVTVGGLALLVLYIIRRGGTRHRTIFDKA